MCSQLASFDVECSIVLYAAMLMVQAVWAVLHLTLPFTIVEFGFRYLPNSQPTTTVLNIVYSSTVYHICALFCCFDTHSYLVETICDSGLVKLVLYLLVYVKLGSICALLYHTQLQYVNNCKKFKFNINSQHINICTKSIQHIVRYIYHKNCQ